MLDSNTNLLRKCMKNKCKRETAKFDFGHIEWKIQAEINHLN